MGKIKAISFLCISVFCVSLFTACNSGKNTLDVTDKEEEKKVYDTIAAEDISHVNLKGNARSIVVKQGGNKYFEFDNADLNKDHKYEVRYEKKDHTLDINILMESSEDDDNVLGSFVIYIPQKEFEKVETTGGFGHIYFETISSDVLVHAEKSVVVLDLEADRLDHNITLEGSEANAFRGVSVYLDKLPDNVRMDLNMIQGGTINDQQNILKQNRFESGTGFPVVSVKDTKDISIYVSE